MADNDKAIRAYSRISSLRANLGPETDLTLHERYVHEFHDALALLTEAEFDVAEFMVPEKELQRDYRGYSPSSGHHYSTELYVDRLLLLTKLDSVLRYFEVAREGQQAIRFSGPGR